MSVRVKPYRKRWLALGIVCLLLVFGAVYGLYPRHVLRIEDTSNQKIILEMAAEPGDNLWVVFINSVERLPVADHFVVDADYRLVYSETIYQAPYAGYLHPEKKELVAPGTIRIADFNRPMQEVAFYAGYDFRHLLFVNGRWIPLYPAARGGDLIRVTLHRRSRWGTLLKQDVIK